MGVIGNYPSGAFAISPDLFRPHHRQTFTASAGKMWFVHRSLGRHRTFRDETGFKPPGKPYANHLISRSTVSISPMGNSLTVSGAVPNCVGMEIRTILEGYVINPGPRLAGVIVAELLSGSSGTNMKLTKSVGW